jgi:glycosyltransferase involved in cell wall biosynthesis
MKIALLGTMVPFVYGGAEFLIDSLAAKLREKGINVNVINLPFEWNPLEKVLESALAFRLVQIENADKVITFKFPAYCAKHQNMSVWLVHQFRQVYDLWGTEYGPPQTPETLAMKKSITELDNFALSEKKIYTNSKIVSDRLMKYNGIASKILYPPLMDEHLFSCKEYGDYIFYPSRVNHSKRQYMAVEAMKHTKSGVKLIIAGKGDTKADETFLLESIEKHGVKDKVTYINKFITQEEKAELFAKSLANIYIPFDEDSYGYVTLEAYHSKKPVITCTDSGGTDVVVLNEKTGYMTPPTPEALGEAMDKLYENKKNAQEMGEAGLKNLGELGISWENVIERLLA